MAHKSCKKFLGDTTFDSDFDVELSGVDFNVKDLNEIEYMKKKRGKKKSLGRWSPDYFLRGKIENRIFAKLADDIDFHPDCHKPIKYKGKALGVFYKK